MEETFDFSKALELLKQGQRVCRSGWNGKGMWLCLITQADYTIYNQSGLNTMLVDSGLSDFKGLLPWVGMYTADNKFVPWLCSQTDMLAEDWQIATS